MKKRLSRLETQFLTYAQRRKMALVKAGKSGSLGLNPVEIVKKVHQKL